MGADQHIDWRAAAASALEWWRDAGVDMLVGEEPRDWLVPARPHTAPPLSQPAASATMPGTLEAFLAWRMGPEAPEASWPGKRLAAEGPPEAPLAVVLDCPDRDDEREGRLLSGDAGRLFDRMLAAIGLTREQVHLFSAAATRPLAGRITRELEARLGEVARHHLALARPERALLMGDAAARAVLGMGCAQARNSLHRVNHEVGQEPLKFVVASFHPRQLLREPRRKADAWRDLQLLMGPTA